MDNLQEVYEFNSLDEFIHEALKNGDTLTTPQESQMLIKMTGISITARPRPDGRYQGYVAKPDGSKRYFYGRTREAVADKIKIYLQEGQTPKRKKQQKYSPTFGEYVEKWIEIYKKPNLKPNTIQSINNVLKPALAKFGNVKLDKIDSDDLQEYPLSIKANRMRELSRTYLKQIFTKVIKQRIIKQNPFDGVEIKHYTSKRKKGLTIDEQKIFTEAAEKSNYSLLFRFLLATGMRIGEALALRHSDIDYEKYTATVSKDVVFIKGERIEQTPKTEAANRTIPISESLCKELREIETDILFPYAYPTVGHNMRLIVKQTGINVSAHILRHTYSDRLEEAGVPPKVKQYLMGHSKLDMTQNVYTDTQEAYVNAHAGKIRELFGQ